ncbi:MAG: hypothetical protein ACR2QK_10840 [Acidimicrobiales bacterium]
MPSAAVGRPDYFPETGPPPASAERETGRLPLAEPDTRWRLLVFAAAGAALAFVPLALGVGLFLWPDDRSPDGEPTQLADSPASPTTTIDGPSNTGLTATVAATAATTATSIVTETGVDRASPTAAPSSIPTTAPPSTSIVGDYPNAPVATGPAGSGCTPGPGPLADGVWFGSIGRWLDGGRVRFDLFCVYGGARASEMAASRNETTAAGAELYAVNDNDTLRSLLLSPDAKARELLTASGSVGPAVPWAEAPDRLDVVNADSVEIAWLKVQGGQVVEAAVAPSSMFHLSLQPLDNIGRDRCANNGLSTGTRLEVFGIPDTDPDGGLNLRTEPGLENPVFATVPNDTNLVLVLSCEVEADGFRWWALDWEGALVWGAAEFLRVP